MCSSELHQGSKPTAQICTSGLEKISQQKQTAEDGMKPDIVFSYIHVYGGPTACYGKQDQFKFEDLLGKTMHVSF